MRLLVFVFRLLYKLIINTVVEVLFRGLIRKKVCWRFSGGKHKAALCVEDISKLTLIWYRTWEINTHWDVSLLKRFLVAMCWWETHGHFQHEGNQCTLQQEIMLGLGNPE